MPHSLKGGTATGRKPAVRTAGGRRKGHREISKKRGRVCSTCSHPEAARIDYLLASGGTLRPIADQFGLGLEALRWHWHHHVSERYKRIVGASKSQSFEKLMAKCVEGDAETLDILDMLIRGHSQQWSIALDAGAVQAMQSHAGKILAATELKSRITRELTPGPTLQVNNFLLHDAAQIVNILRDHPEAAEKLERWHMRRLSGRVIEHDAAE
jgi:hypothetical protein